MDSSNSFNARTVDWQKPGAVIDASQLPGYVADAADIEAFQRDGVVLLRGAFADWVERLRAGLQRNLDNPQGFAFPCESNPQGAPGRFFDSYCNWQLIPEYFDFVAHSPAAALAGQFMGGERAQFFHEHAFLKAPGTQRATPWHQDLPYYCVDGQQTASVYVSLDQADADVAVQFVKGSHRWGKLFYPRVFEDGSSFNDDQPNDQQMEPVPDIDAQRDDYDIAAWSLEPGDTIVFDFRTLHGTGDATVHKLRRAFSTRWLGDDITYCERPGETSPPYTGHEMRHGEPMRADWFPVLWRRAD
jgi:ectoine hydroxylase-related dioxygenase (phytanoyl-CoA dioxygenase family)